MYHFYFLVYLDALTIIPKKKIVLFHELFIHETIKIFYVLIALFFM